MQDILEHQEYLDEEKEEAPYFSRDQYYSSIKRGIVTLDDDFKIYTKALLQQRRTQQDSAADFDLLLPENAITLSK